MLHLRAGHNTPHCFLLQFLLSASFTVFDFYWCTKKWVLTSLHFSTVDNCLFKVLQAEWIIWICCKMTGSPLSWEVATYEDAFQIKISSSPWCLFRLGGSEMNTLHFKCAFSFLIAPFYATAFKKMCYSQNVSFQLLNCAIHLKTIICLPGHVHVTFRLQFSDAQCIKLHDMSSFHSTSLPGLMIWCCWLPN